MNDQREKLVWQLRLTYVLIVLLVGAAVLTPIWIRIPEYPFFLSNILFIAVFFIGVYWIFFLRFVWFRRSKWIKLIILFLVLPMVILLMDHFSDFQSFLDDFGIHSLVDHLHYWQGHRLARFVRNEMIFFGVASMMTTILVGFRMIISIWRYKNKGTF